MSVIWSGITEGGAVVPVQVTDEGKVVAVGDGPEGDFLPLTGGELTGPLTSTSSASFAGTVNTSKNIAAGGNASIEGNVSAGYGDTSTGCLLSSNGNASFSSDLNVLGSATFAGGVSAAAGKITLSDTGRLFAEESLRTGSISTGSASNSGANLYGVGSLDIQRSSSGKVFRAFEGTSENVTINSNGSATFTGDVIIGSRGSKWLIRESNGVAMLIEQTLRQPRMQKVRDLPNELDLIEAALNEVMAKLKMVPPAGWPVWDGQDEVTPDNDNA